MAVHQEGTPPPPPKPKKQPSLEEGVTIIVDTEKLKFKGIKDGVVDVELKEQDESVYIKDGALHINLDAGKS